MKIKFTCSLQPLQNRIKTKPEPEKTSFLKAVSIVWPILVYHVISQVIIILFAYFMQWISLADTELLSLAEWLRTHSVLVSGGVKALSMGVAAAVVWQMFIKESPVFLLPKGYKKDTVLLFVLGGSAALFVNILFSLLHITGSVESYEQVAQQQFALPLWAGIVLYGIISPIAEEIVFRGIVYNRLRRQYSLWIAIIGSALIFGFYHGNIVQAAYGFFLGLLIAIMYEKYASFVVPVLLHGAANICVYFVSSLETPGDYGMIWPMFFVSALLFVVLLLTCLSKRGKG